MKIKVNVALGLVGCTIKDTLELDDNMSDADIDQEVHDWAMNYIEYWWDKIKERDDEDD